MISVLTLTYKRPSLLEEAIESFLQSMTYSFRYQDGLFQTEMVVINDNPEVDYVFEHPHVRIINHKERFPSISAKIEWGYKQCKYDYIYRLDDDDLLAPWALNNAQNDITNHPGYDIYRSKGMYFFSENKFEGIQDNINNGNVYSRKYLDRIKFPDKSGNEDEDITFHHNATIYTSTHSPSMLYRWGMGTFHISGLGSVTPEVINNHADKVLDNTTGIISLHPQFLNDYYAQIDKIG